MILERCECGASAKMGITRVNCSRAGCEFELCGLHVSTWNKVMRALRLVKRAEPFAVSVEIPTPVGLGTAN